MGSLVTFVCAHASPATRAACFPTDDAVADDFFVMGASKVPLPQHARAITSPNRLAQQTAAQLGLVNLQLEPALREVSYGLWAGKSLKEIDAHGLAQWLQDPSMRPPDGESLVMVQQRVVDWFQAVEWGDGHSLVFTHANVIKLLVLHLLDAPITSALGLDIAPLSQTRISRFGDRWRVQCVGAEMT